MFLRVVECDMGFMHFDKSVYNNDYDNKKKKKSRKWWEQDKDN